MYAHNWAAKDSVHYLLFFPPLAASFNKRLERDAVNICGAEVVKFFGRAPQAKRWALRKYTPSLCKQTFSQTIKVIQNGYNFLSIAYYFIGGAVFLLLFKPLFPFIQEISRAIWLCGRMCEFPYRVIIRWV
jgi:hypothetical protein